jgi:hypothetical protein
VKCGGDKCKVGWNIPYASFCLMKNGWMYDHYFHEALNPTDCEIIGNIYENHQEAKDV